MGWEYYQTIDPLKREPQVGRGLFGVHLLIFHFKFQVSKSIKSSTFHLTNPLRKNISFQKCPKNHPKIYTKQQTLVIVLIGRIWRCLKRERGDIGRKAKLSDVKTAFR